MNMPARFVIVCVTKSFSPMTKIGRNDEQILWIGQIRCENFAINGLNIGWYRTNQNRHDGKLIAKTEIIEYHKMRSNSNARKKKLKSTHSSITFAMYGRCISMLCSSSSVFMSIQVNLPVFSSSALIWVSIWRSYNGVSYLSAIDNAQPRNRTWCDGPRMNTRLLKQNKIKNETKKKRINWLSAFFKRFSVKIYLHEFLAKNITKIKNKMSETYTTAGLTWRYANAAQAPQYE